MILRFVGPNDDARLRELGSVNREVGYSGGIAKRKVDSEARDIIGAKTT